jgi:hypothetical protein
MVSNLFAARNWGSSSWVATEGYRWIDQDEMQRVTRRGRCRPRGGAIKIILLINWLDYISSYPQNKKIISLAPN